jgi:DNA-binding FadR family transcriptional regulator
VFHIAILQACSNPFFAQFESFVSTALRTSISFTNRFNDRDAGLAAYKAVLDAIAAHDAISASIASRSIIEDLMILIRKVENEGG